MESNIALPGVSIRSGPGPVDLRIWLKVNKKCAPIFNSSLNHIFYPDSCSNPQGISPLQAGTIGDTAYIGLFYADGARFAIDRQGREIWADWPENYTLEDACTYLVGPVLGFALRLRGMTGLHASSIAIGGRAIALMGPPGTGKSTTAAAFAQLGFPVLSDDIAVLADLGDRILVQPGYPRINLWPDSVSSLFDSEDALPHITPTWGKRYLPLDQNGHHFQAAPLPLAAIYLLENREASLAAPVMKQLTPREALIPLVANTYVNYLLDSSMRHREFDILSRVANEIPVRRVQPADKPSGVFDLCYKIAADAVGLNDREIAVAEAG